MPQHATVRMASCVKHGEWPLKYFACPKCFKDGDVRKPIEPSLPTPSSEGSPIGVTGAQIYHDALRQTRLAIRYADGTEEDKPVEDFIRERDDAQANATAWHQATMTAGTLLGLPGGLGAYEFAAEVQRYVARSESGLSYNPDDYDTRGEVPILRTPPSAGERTINPAAYPRLAGYLELMARGNLATDDKDTLNAAATALREAASTSPSAIGTTYRQVGWAQIELRATQGGMLYEVAGSVSEERTEHHTEPVYIAVVEAADSGVAQK